MDEKSKQFLLLHGPDFVGKHTFYTRELKKSHKALQPSKLFNENPSLGFRDIGLEIIKLLKKGQKIALIDTSDLRKTRLSYINLLKKKCDCTSVSVVSVLPKYGYEQLFWTRELRLASEACQSVDDKRSEIILNDRRILKWFEKETDCEIQYTHGVVEEPVQAEECHVVKLTPGIYTSSVYKVIFGFASSKQKLLQLTKAFDLWAAANHCGRIIVVCDGSQIYTGEKTRSQQQRDIDETMKHLTSKLTSDTPVYVFHVSDPKHAGCYVIPPKPGILAYLQQRHSLNLHSRRSMYIYEAPTHMQMAENAGIRHIKATRIIEHPSLVVSGHAASTPTIPDMLKTLKLLPGCQGLPQIPLGGTQYICEDGRITQELPHGRSEYLYAASINIIQRYNDLYVEQATKVGEPGSKLSPKTHYSNDESKTSHDRSIDLSGNQSKLSVSSRDLPTWMLKGKKRQQSSLSEESNNTNTDVKTEKKIRKTVYVMTEKELVDVACDILRQGGRESIVNNFLCKESDNTNIECDSNTKSDCKVSSAKHVKLRRGNDNSESSKSEESDIGNRPGSLCSKIEPDPDWDIEKKIDTQLHNEQISEKKTSCSKHSDREMRQVMVSDTVADVLDDFSSSQIPAKLSPKKRNRPAEDKSASCSTPSKQPNCNTLVSEDAGKSRSTKTLHSSDLTSVNIGRRTRRTPDLSYLDDMF